MRTAPFLLCYDGRKPTAPGAGRAARPAPRITYQEAPMPFTSLDALPSREIAPGFHGKFAH